MQLRRWDGRLTEDRWIDHILGLPAQGLEGPGMFDSIRAIENALSGGRALPPRYGILRGMNGCFPGLTAPRRERNNQRIADER